MLTTMVSNPEMNASMRTTTALTIIDGDVEDNTIPAEGMGRMVKFCAPLMKVWGTKEMFMQERSIQT
jgi:hypothetical protein